MKVDKTKVLSNYGKGEQDQHNNNPSTTKLFTLVNTTTDCTVDHLQSSLMFGGKEWSTVKFFTATIYGFLCLSLASLSSLVKCLQVRPEPTRVKDLSGA